MKKFAALLTFLTLTGSALAQGPGPGPAPNPWVVNGPTISYSNGGILVPSTVTGGTKGVGTLNATGLYIGGSNVLNQLAAGTWPGATSITTLGTVTSGTWHASAVGTQYGGTGATSLTSNAFLTGNGINTINQVAITGLVKGNGGSAPTAYAGTSCGGGEFVNALSAAGASTCAAVSLPGDVAYLDVVQSFTAAQRSVPCTLTISTATFTPNFDGTPSVCGGQNIYITLVHSACPCTIANPSTTPVAGQSGVFKIVQSATGSDTVGTWGSDYITPSGTSTIALSSAANARDYLSYYVDDSSHIVISVGALNATH